MQHSILILDDEPNMRLVMRMTLEDAGYRVQSAERAEQALELLTDPELDLVLSDLKLPGMSGEEFVALSRQRRPDVPIIVVTAYGSIRSAIGCIQAGATDYLTKPFETEELQIAVRNALQLGDLQRENSRMRAVIQDSQKPQHLIGCSAAMGRIREQIAQVAPYRSTLLITGESGTGKEAVAREIRDSGPWCDRPWVALNCSAIPHDLMESELFGYVKGAFTGALQNRMGRLEQANGGTLFLDEIGDLALNLQTKLLRVLQEREFSPLGSDMVKRVDVRIIAATNRNLREMVSARNFREDLLYRLDVFNIQVPPLRERREDIPMLAGHFLTELRHEIDKPVQGFSQEAQAAMQDYDWPGNVRELRNAVERALLSCRSATIELEDLPEHLLAPAPRLATTDGEQSLDSHIASLERSLILDALKDSQGVQVQAARLLGIPERSLWYRIKKLGITIERGVKH